MKSYILSVIVDFDHVNAHTNIGMSDSMEATESLTLGGSFVHVHDNIPSVGPFVQENIPFVGLFFLLRLPVVGQCEKSISSIYVSKVHTILPQTSTINRHFQRLFHQFNGD